MKSFTLLSWNIQGVKHFTQTPFRKIANYLNETDIDIICLQEIPCAREKITSLHHYKDYHIIISSQNNASEHQLTYNHNIILSRFPIFASGEIIFPQTICKYPLERISWADISINNNIIRVYNCHLRIIGVGIVERRKQMQIIYAHAKKFRGPVIICGDMNTTISRAGFGRRVVQLVHHEPTTSLIIDGVYETRDERDVFLAQAKINGFTEVFDITRPTWALSPICWEIFNLKLDWCLMRGIIAQTHRLGPYISDHRPIMVQCAF